MKLTVFLELLILSILTKKKFSKNFCFDTDTVKILNAVKIENSQKSRFFIILTGDFDTFES